MVVMVRKGPISGRTLYTAEEYLKMDKYKITGKLKRELDEIQRKYDESQHKSSKKGKTIKLKPVLKKIVDEFSEKLVVSKGKGYHYVKKGKHLVCWLAQRKYGVSVSYNKDDERITERITNKSDIKNIIKTLREEYDS